MIAAACNVSSFEFLLRSLDPSFLRFTSNTCWPWTNSSLDEWRHVSRISSRINAYLSTVQLVVMCASILGIVGSLCSLLALWRKAVELRRHFYAFMFVISVLELIFNCTYLFTAFCFGFVFPNSFRHSFAGTELSRWMGSIGGTCSLEADMCTLVLTIERCVVLSRRTPTAADRPAYHHDAGGQHHNRSVVIIGTILTTCLTAVRLVVRCTQYKTAEDGLDEHEDHVVYVIRFSEISQQSWFRCFILVSDILLPFVLLIVMFGFTARIARIVLRQRRARINGFDSGDIQQRHQHSSQERSSATLTLLFILVFLFVWNQIGYCLYAISLLQLRSKTITYEMSYVEIDDYARSMAYWCVSNLISYSMECLSRSMNFYIYCRFSKSMRDEFRKAVCRVVEKLLLRKT